ncbi:hypothetical protein D9M68_17670 [compost metagenome]
MSVFSIGQTVWAGKILVTDACGDHPSFLHARAGDELIVLAYEPGREYPYSVADNPEGLESFRACAKDLMGQKPFKHNLEQRW